MCTVANVEITVKKKKKKLFNFYSPIGFNSGNVLSSFVFKNFVYY